MCLIRPVLHLPITIHVLYFVIPFDFTENTTEHTAWKDIDNHSDEAVTTVKVSTVSSDDTLSKNDDMFSTPTINDDTFKRITMGVSISAALLILAALLSLIRASKMSH